MTNDPTPHIVAELDAIEADRNHLAGAFCWEPTDGFNLASDPLDREVSWVTNKGVADKVFLLLNKHIPTLLTEAREAARLRKLLTQSDKRAGDWCRLSVKVSKENAQLEARVAELEAAQEWQPIETAPDKTPVLILAKGMAVEGFYEPPRRDYDPVSGEYDVEGDVWHCFDAQFELDDCEATHWMPLPQPPAQEGE